MSQEPSHDFAVSRSSLSEFTWLPAQTRADQPLAEGDVLLRVDRFALTANNITYAAAGDLMRYWQFFPAPDGWGRIPVWGFADVVASRHPELKEGERYFGYLPMSELLRVRPENVGKSGWSDGSEHRKSLPPLYQSYQRVGRADETSEAVRALLLPLFGTGFIIDDWLLDNGVFGAKQVVFASASSKTALSAAFQLSRRNPRDFHVVGLTSERNRAFVERLGYYDQVLPYSELTSLSAAQPAVLIDMAGSSTVLAGVHQHFGEALRYSCNVGLTHRSLLSAPPANLAGPAPQLFFAPTQIDKRRKEWGAEEFGRRLKAAQEQFFPAVQQWLELEHGKGPAAIESAYRRVLDGMAEPQRGIILSP
jgi:hypothetical protein